LSTKFVQILFWGAQTLWFYTEMRGNTFPFHRRIFINLLQYFHLFCDCSVLATSFVWLRHLSKVQIPKGAATYFSPCALTTQKALGNKHDNWLLRHTCSGNPI